ALEIVYDPERISYRTLLEYFFQIHDPTTKNRQGNDIGTQYRSAIFPLDEAQRRTAEEVIRTVDGSGEWGAPVITRIEPFKAFWRAEEVHQHYLLKHPNGYTCHFVRKFNLGETA
ncbi:MAG: peptide-methionine (S)-S-oxide reductase MsrA, partial [Gallionellaceae bacterium]|nr:peptide-methionine (S)-S-oxide reductase MsrA [Gallionellaceae bacterium]